MNFDNKFLIDIHNDEVVLSVGLFPLDLYVWIIIHHNSILMIRYREAKNVQTIKTKWIEKAFKMCKALDNN